MRTVIVTGGSSGIGLAAARMLAGDGAAVVLLGRHPGRLARAVEAVRAAGGTQPRAYQCDFAALDEVRSVAARIRDDVPQVDVLVNNAGALATVSRPTVDRLDRTMQVNHLAGFLLTHLLLDRLRGTPDQPARLITTTSMAEAWGWLDPDRPGANLGRYRLRWLAYGASKQANILFTVEAARRWTDRGIVATCFFPGLVRSRFARTSPLFGLGRLVPFLFRSPAAAARDLVWLANDPAALVPGGYFAFRQPFMATPWSTDPDRARRLWTASLAAVGLATTGG